MKAITLPAVTSSRFPYDEFYAIKLPASGLAEVIREGSSVCLGFVWSRDQWYCYDRNMQPIVNEFGIHEPVRYGDDAIMTVVEHEVAQGRLVLTERSVGEAVPHGD